MNNYEELSGLRNGQWMTDSTDLAASLMACGVAPLKDGPVSNTYTKENPHRKGRPGKVLYHLQTKSDTFLDSEGSPVTADKLAAGYNSKDANETLDALIEKIQDEPLRAKIKDQLPLASMSHHRAAMGNRSVIRKWWRQVEPWVFLKKGKKKFLLPRKSKETAKRWGLTE